MMDLFNTRILDANIRDVVINLSDIPKADVLLHALQHLGPTRGCRVVIENAVQSLLQVPNLPPTNVASALSLRAKRRLAEGDYTSGQKDFQSALMVDPEAWQGVKTTIRSQNVPTGRSLIEPDCPPRFPEEIWWRIALFLPRRDLKTVLFVSNALSRIASQLLFRDVKLRFPTPSEGVDSNTWHRQRNTGILTRISVDPRFAGQVKDLSISNHIIPHAGFNIGMLMRMLPRLLNLRKLHCCGNKTFITRVLKVVHLHHPHLQRLSLSVVDSRIVNIRVPVFKHLTHFAICSFGGDGSSGVCRFLARSQNTPRCLSVRNPTLNFSAKAICSRHLTQIEFDGNFLTDAFLEIFENGHQVESLILSGRLQCIASSLFRQYCSALPFLRHLSITIAGLQQNVVDTDFSHALSDFVRERAQLRTYRLIVPLEVASRIGFDASTWGVLPGLSKLSSLSITFPEDLLPSAAGWLVPRTVRALTLDLSHLYKYSTDFMNQLHPGIPPLLCYIGVTNTSVNSVLTVIEQGFPNVRVARVCGTFWTVTRSGEDGALRVERLPPQRGEHYMGEWLNSFGCPDAVWEGVDRLWCL